MRFQNSFCSAVRKVEERARGRRHLFALYNGFHDAAVQLGDDDADDGARHQEGGVQRQRTGLLAPHARHAYSEEVLQVHEKISVDCFLFGSRINVGGSGGDGSPTAQELRQATAEQADKNSAAHDEMRAAELGHACHSNLNVVERLFQPALAAWLAGACVSRAGAAGVGRRVAEGGKEMEQVEQVEEVEQVEVEEVEVEEVEEVEVEVEEVEEVEVEVEVEEVEEVEGGQALLSHAGAATVRNTAATEPFRVKKTKHHRMSV
jgi:hypothetical protein